MKDKVFEGAFQVQGICLAQLCHSIAAFPGVVFTYRRRFYYWSDIIFAAFTFKGQEFTITPAPYADGWCVQRAQKHVAMEGIKEIEAHVRIACQTPWTFWESLGFRKRNK